jgi:hypothetical protein
MRYQNGLVAFLVVALSACGGGGGDGATEPPQSASPQSARIETAGTSAKGVAPAAPVAPKPISANLSAGDQVVVSFTATTNTKGTAMVSGLDEIALAGSLSVKTQGIREFLISFTTSPTLTAGTYRGFVTVNFCVKFLKGSTGCQSVARGQEVRVPFEIVVGGTPVNIAGEWNTFQRDAKHTGYVPVTLDTSKFSKIWEWTDPAGGRITAPTIADGRVAISQDRYFAEQTTFVLNKLSGTAVWSHNFGYIAGLNPPAMKDGKLYVATSGHSDTYLWGFNAATGEKLFSTPFSAQWEHYLAPTIADGDVFTAGGYHGGIYSFAAADGAQKWFTAGPQNDMFTPAVSATDAYYYAYGYLYAVNRADGSLRFTIPDPYYSWYGYSQISAPILGSSGANVIAFSGSNFSGTASSSTGGYSARKLLNFDLAQRTIAWQSANAYVTQPALLNSTLYAGLLTTPRIDAIGEQDGLVKWSWTATSGDSRTCRNVIATNNLIFVSTDVAVYAIDIASRKAVWSYPVSGDLAMDNGDTLVISVGCRESQGKLVAIKLK